ncbi:MAG: DUF3025 domain-containing protein [Gallionella sp.]|nr:DUF3025 domain-containing protein [Gallionella sp.]
MAATSGMSDSVTLVVMKKSNESGWDALQQSVLFAPLRSFIALLAGSRQEVNCPSSPDTGGASGTESGRTHFPALARLNALLDARHITVQNGCALRFVAQGVGRAAFEAQYEPRCYLTGEVQTRADNWHDLLNALIWLSYPKAKAAINARHYLSLTEEGRGAPSGRGGVRDTCTLLDESGVIVACADDELACLLKNFQWKELFWNRRARVKSNMGFYLFGHGLCEKAFHPYTGMTGQGLVLAVKSSFFTLAHDEQLAYLDGLLADYLYDPARCLSTRELSPVPLLGVPGWTAENENASYYDNTAYFRPGRRPQLSGAASRSGAL